MSDSDSDDYYGSDDESSEGEFSEDESLVSLPDVVSRELESREEAEERGDVSPSSPNELAVNALREHFESGNAQPFVHGGFLQLMRDLGATPKSTDPLVKDSKHNIWYLGRTGEDTPEWWQEREEDHRTEVRLLRYAEFEQSQEAKGLGPDPEWTFLDEGSDDYYLLNEDADEKEAESDKDVQEEEYCESEDLTKDQLVSITDAFIKGLWQYANLDNVYHGLAKGVLSLSESIGPGKVRFVQIETSADGLVGQCEELCGRYQDQQRPLGPSSAFNPAKAARPKKGKKNRRRRQQQSAGGLQTAQNSHPIAVAGHVKRLVSALEENMLPSGATAQVVDAVSRMLSAAVVADPSIARAMADDDVSSAGGTVTRMRAKAVEYAMAADDDLSRPSWVGDMWWDAFDSLTYLLGDTVNALGAPEDGFRTKDSSSSTDLPLAEEFAKECVFPVLLESVASLVSAERVSSLRALSRVVDGVSPKLSLALVVKEKSTWSQLEAACKESSQSVDATPGSSSSTSESSAMRRERRASPLAAIAATSLLATLCMRDMLVDEVPGVGTPVFPGSLAGKLIQRGIVPLLMEAARSPIHGVVCEAARALAEISRVKDCRAVMLQEPGSRELVSDMVSSRSGDVVGRSLLLVLHLFWDKAWREVLMALDPPIERVAVRWAAYSMKLIRERSYEALEDEKKSRNKQLQDRVRIYNLKEENPDESERIEHQINEEKEKAKKEPSWLELEWNQSHHKQFNYTLSRSLLLLSTMLHHQDAPKRLSNVGVLALAAACDTLQLLISFATWLQERVAMQFPQRTSLTLNMWFMLPCIAWGDMLIQKIIRRGL